MRRAAIASLLLGIAASACAAPEFDLRPRFLPGEVRVYRLAADATVRISAGRASSSERSRLVATTTIRVESTSSSGTTLRLTVAARSLTRNGRAAQVPPPQEIRMTVAPDGRVTNVTAGSQQTALEAADVEDLVPLIGPPPQPGAGGLGSRRRIHLGDRWTRTSGAPAPTASPAPTTSPSPSPSPTATPSAVATQDARLAALRVVDDYDCAIIAVSTRRPVVRERVIAGQSLRLAGMEFAASEIAFAFREGLPVSVLADSEARLAIAGSAGSVVISTKTSLTLERRTAPGLR